MPGLVLEGGTFRPVFSCGVMDALLDNDIMFDYVIGVSAGITYAASYLSRQRERNINILRQYRGDKRYFGARNLLHDHSIFGTDFVFDTIPNQLVPFDWDEFHKYQGKYLVGVTNAKTGKAEYLDGMRMDRPCTMLRATCAIPIYFPPVQMDGETYYDGGRPNPDSAQPARRQRAQSDRAHAAGKLSQNAWTRRAVHRKVAETQISGNAQGAA